MIENETRITTPDGSMKTFMVRPDGDGPFPVALLYMDGIGYREQIRANARRFAAAGYYVVAPDLFYRSGDDVTVNMAAFSAPPDDPERARVMAIMGAVTPARVDADTDAILAVLAADPAADTAQLVCVGYCMGARMSLHTAATREGVAAAACIHPGALVTDAPESPHRELPSVHGELYVAFAEQDRTATPESIEKFRTAMQEAGVTGDVERVPGTAHGFSMADLPVYNQEASERHFAKTIDLWRRHSAN